MKSIKIPENIKNKSLDDLQKEILDIISELEKEEDLKGSTDKYQRLLQLNNIVEDKFREKAKLINLKTIDVLKNISKKID